MPAPLATPRLLLEPLVAAHATETFGPLQDVLRARYERLSRRRSPDGSDVRLNWVLPLREGDPCVGTLEATVFLAGTAIVAQTVLVPHRRLG